MHVRSHVVITKPLRLACDPMTYNQRSNTGTQICPVYYVSIYVKRINWALPLHFSLARQCQHSYCDGVSVRRDGKNSYSETCI